MTAAQEKAGVVCIKCDAQFNPAAWQVRQGDYRCADCRNAYDRARRERQRASGLKPKRDPQRAAEYERMRSKDPAVRERRASDMKRYQKDPEMKIRFDARSAARRAIATGRLVKMPCEQCGDHTVHAHHDDYTKPLAVRWLCPPCHRDWHKHNTPIYPEARAQGKQP